MTKKTEPMKASEVDLSAVAASDDLLDKQARRRARKQREARAGALTKMGVDRPSGSPDLHARLEASVAAAQRDVIQKWQSRKVVANRLKESGRESA